MQILLMLKVLVLLISAIAFLGFSVIAGASAYKMFNDSEFPDDMKFMGQGFLLKANLRHFITAWFFC